MKQYVWIVVTAEPDAVVVGVYASAEYAEEIAENTDAYVLGPHAVEWP